MGYLLDTDVVIHLRDGEPGVLARVGKLDPPLFVAAISRIELEGGVYRDPAWSAERRAALDTIMGNFATLELTEAVIASYRAIVESAGFSKRKINDRITAATALTHGLILVTMNGGDFRDVPELECLEWESPASSPNSHPPS